MNLSYCIECAVPLDKVDDTHFTCTNGHTYYNNPRAAVAVIFINKEKEVLFARRAHEPAKSSYDFPGGFLDFGETPDEAALREVKEEMHIDIEDYELLCATSNIYMKNVSTCDVVYVCTKWRGKIEPSDDVAALEWKPLEFLNSPDFAWEYKGVYKKLKSYIDHLI